MLKFALTLIAAVSALSVVPASGAETTPLQAYNEALTVMNALSQPARIDFTASVTINGAGIKMNRNNGAGALQIGAGRSFRPTDSWKASFQVADASAVVHAPDGETLKVRSPLFKPTWKTATIWARYGFRGSVEAPPPVAAPTPEAVSSEGQVIGRITSLASSGYHIQDGVPEKCSDTTRPTRHLHFSPVLAVATHPLTDIVIDDETKRVCEMRFRVATTAAISLTGYVRIDFGERGSYYMVTGGGGDYFLRFFGFGMKHASMSFAIQNPTFE